ncbi:DUF317 domain-containing protein [Streptomyces sp. NPDC127033]|uniref:DUF317 domain-containing protein n=1 Tax=Streptomyces sp. NPDC127033 TaxID=3347110 RepID=UPI00364DC5AF
MPVNERQIAEFAADQRWSTPFDTSPRHLAGRGDPRHFTHGLAAAGWTRASSDPLSPEFVLRSPDRRTSLHFDPYNSHWWDLRAEPTGNRPGWGASFSKLVPAEILSSLTDALHTPPPAKDPDPWQTLTAADWHLDDQGVSRSPDRRCRVNPYPLHRQKAATWQIVAHDHGYDGPDGLDIWSARFDSRTPAHLVNIFVTALVDTTPLQRPKGETADYSATTQERSSLTPQQIVDAHTARLHALSAQARAAQRRKPNTTVAPAPPGRTTTPLRH